MLRFTHTQAHTHTHAHMHESTHTHTHTKFGLKDSGSIIILLYSFHQITMIMCRKKTSPTSFMNFCMRVRNLLTKTLWPGDEAKGGITHNLDLYVEVDEHGNETLVGTEMVSGFSRKLYNVISYTSLSEDVRQAFIFDVTSLS